MRGRISIIGLMMLFFLISASPAHALNFYLTPQSTAVNVGDVFGVDIGLNNDSGALLNGAVLTFSYDESYLELQDTDAGNMTGTGSGPSGTNIMDAKHFSGWDTGLDMIANLQQQYMLSHPYAVHYEVMYTSDAARDGIFGRAYFKALKSSPSTQLVFGSFYGLDEGIYIDPDYNPVNVTDNVDASVDVVPEPGTLSLLLGGLTGITVFIKKNRKRP